MGDELYFEHGGCPCSWLVRLRGSIAGTPTLDERVDWICFGGWVVGGGLRVDGRWRCCARVQNVTVKCLARLSWSKLHILKKLASFLRVVVAFSETLAGSMLGRCEFLVGSLRVCWFLGGPRLHEDSSQRSCPSGTFRTNSEAPGNRRKSGSKKSVPHQMKKKVVS